MVAADSYSDATIHKATDHYRVTKINHIEWNITYYK